MEWTVEEIGIIAAIAAAASTVIAAVIGWALLKAGKHPAPSMLVLSVALLSMTALLGGLIFDSDSSIAIASAGLGALAGAVSSTFTIQPRMSHKQEEEETDG